MFNLTRAAEKPDGVFLDVCGGYLEKGSNRRNKCFDATGVRVTPIFYYVRNRKLQLIKHTDLDANRLEGTTFAWLLDETNQSYWSWCTPPGYKPYGKTVNRHCNRKGLCPWCWAREAYKSVYLPLHNNLKEVQKILTSRLGGNRQQVRKFKDACLDREHPFFRPSYATFVATQVIPDFGPDFEQLKIRVAEAMVEQERLAANSWFLGASGHSTIVTSPSTYSIDRQVYPGVKIRVVTQFIGLNQASYGHLNRKIAKGRYPSCQIRYSRKVQPIWTNARNLAWLVGGAIQFPRSLLSGDRPGLISPSWLLVRTKQFRSFGNSEKLKEIFNTFDLELTSPVKGGADDANSL